MISEETIARVRDANDIVEVIGESVPNLKRAGKDFKGLCPFHQEKTPSFMVSPSKGIFHCFGCGVGGDVFKFVMEMERCAYPEAIRKLAERKGIPILESESRRDYSKEQEERKTLLQVLQRAAQYYHKLLLESEEAEEARHYLTEKRKLTLDTIREFQLGYAPGSGQALVKTAVKAGIRETDLAKAGLLIRSQRDGRWVDWFRRRIVFPIFDVKGNPVAFGGRILESQKKFGDNPPPKYINTADTSIFHKGKNLYGFYQGAKAIRDRREVIVLEGYMDVIGCHQAGVKNAVAPLGTALTADQCQVLKRYVEQVTLLFDADAAGDNAALRGSDLLLDYGFLPMVARLPERVDADELLEREGLEGFAKILKDKISVVEFRINAIWARNAEAPDVIKKALVSQSVMPLILKIGNEVVKAEMLKLVAERLGVPQESLYAELKKARTQSEQVQKKREALRQAAPEAQAPARKDSLRRRVEEELLCLAIRHPELRAGLEKVGSEFTVFTDARCAEAHAALRAHPNVLQVGDLLGFLEAETSRWLSALLFLQLEYEKPREVFDALLKRLDTLDKEAKRKDLEKQVIEDMNRGEVNPRVMEYQKLAKSSKGTQNF